MRKTAETQEKLPEKYRDPDELIRSLIDKAVEYSLLEKIFRQSFPNEKIERWIDSDQHIRTKHVQGLGKFLFYSSPGKMDFHEKLLDIILTQLKEKKIPAKRGRKKRGADFFLFANGKKIYCELETGLLTRSEYRPNLEARIRRYPDRAIILVCNQSDKKRYLRSNLRFLNNREPTILTIWEFLHRETRY